MRIVFAAICGFALDLILGDPVGLACIHPVVLIGRCISALEKLLRRIFLESAKGEIAAGAVLVALVVLGTAAVTVAAIYLLGLVWLPLGVALEVVWCWQALAVKDLGVESMRVYDALAAGDIAAARQAVSRIVGRDTDRLDAEGVAKATVETVAENFSDGVAAPMLYMLIGGAPLALVYKAINTMDSMLGYKNERYLYFGRVAARLDDAAGFIPARMAALLLAAAAKLRGWDGKSALRIWRRDRRKHASPNSAQCEAAMAGALGLELGGPAYYFGELHEKPTLGDETRPTEPEDIRRSVGIMRAAAAICMALLCAVRIGLALIIK